MLLTYVAIRATISQLALAFLRRDASTVQTWVGTNRYADFLYGTFCKSLAAFLDDLLFYNCLIFVDRFKIDFVLGTSRRKIEAPREFSDLIGFLHWNSHDDMLSAKNIRKLRLT